MQAEIRNRANKPPLKKGNIRPVNYLRVQTGWNNSDKSKQLSINNNIISEQFTMSNNIRISVGNRFAPVMDLEEEWPTHDIMDLEDSSAIKSLARKKPKRIGIGERREKQNKIEGRYGKKTWYI